MLTQAEIQVVTQKLQDMLRDHNDNWNAMNNNANTVNQQIREIEDMKITIQEQESKISALMQQMQEQNAELQRRGQEIKDQEGHLMSCKSQIEAQENVMQQEQQVQSALRADLQRYNQMLQSQQEEIQRLKNQILYLKRTAPGSSKDNPYSVECCDTDMSGRRPAMQNRGGGYPGGGGHFMYAAPFW